MASTYTDLCVHIVFSTRERRNWIDDAIRDRFHAYVGGICRSLRATPLSIGGHVDHIHLLVGVPPDLRLSDLVREVKKRSNAWLRQTAGKENFAWQEGYAVFSVGSSERAMVRRYIENQETHHQNRTSRDELRDLLVEHGIEIDDRYFD